MIAPPRYHLITAVFHVEGNNFTVQLKFLTMFPHQFPTFSSIHDILVPLSVTSGAENRRVDR